MSNARIQKKKHTNLLADFFIEASQDPEWSKKMKEMGLEDKLDTSELGYPEFFDGFFPEAQSMELEFSRSEEHTSELQSRPHLVCRLLLEKKKNKKKRDI